MSDEQIKKALTRFVMEHSAGLNKLTEPPPEPAPDPVAAAWTDLSTFDLETNQFNVMRGQQRLELIRLLDAAKQAAAKEETH